MELYFAVSSGECAPYQSSLATGRPKGIHEVQPQVAPHSSNFSSSAHSHRVTYL